MVRVARVVAAGVGREKPRISGARFALRVGYLDTACERSRPSGVTLLGYCLMRSHAHLVAIPNRRPNCRSSRLTNASFPRGEPE